jgi:Tfp pilus assembly protein PilF/type II secretory pathway predicted ATPase ExeA
MSETFNTNLFLSLYGTKKSEGCVVITGAIDTCQSTICQMVLKEPNNKSHSGPTQDYNIYESKRIESILQNLVILGSNTEKRIKKEKVSELIIFLLNSMKKGESALLVIDDTQNILMSLMEQTKIISSLEAQRDKLLHIILLGQKGKIQSLHSPQLKQSDQKTSVRNQLNRPKEDAVRKYFEHRLITAGSQEGIDFSPEALAFIRNNPLGIPCIVNLIFDNVLLGVHTKKILERTEEIDENTIDSLQYPIKETAIVISGKKSNRATWFEKMTMSVFIPAAVSVFVGAVAIGFYISQNITTKKVSDHKPEETLSRYQHMVTEPEEIEKTERFKQAVYYQKSGDLIKAKEQYMEMIKRYPMDYEIHNNLGSVYQSFGEFENAIKEYRKAMLINPNYQKARNNLGVALYEKGNLEAAMREFEIIYESNPEDVQCLTNLGVLSKKMKRSDKARKFFEEALSIDPTFTEAHYNLAMILKTSEVAGAIFHFQKFLEYSGGQYASLKAEVIQQLEGLSNKPKM